MKDICCPFCTRLLLKNVEYIKAEIKCTRCKKIINLEKSKPEPSHTKK